MWSATNEEIGNTAKIMQIQHTDKLCSIWGDGYI